MFEPAAETFVDLKKVTMVHLYHSLNAPSVSMGDGLPPLEAKAHLMVVQPKARFFEIVIGLFFRESGRRVLYKREPFPCEALEPKLSDAQAFVEQMGFIMDNVNFERSSGEDKQNLLRTVPFLYQDIDHYYQALNPTELKYLKAKAENSSPVDNQKLFLEQYLRIVSML
jgi:hypothetical protein